MGNVQARRRIKASDFDYLAKNTNFLTLEVGGMAQPPWLKAAHKHTPVDKERKIQAKAVQKFSSCRWQKASSPRSPRRIQGDKWRRMTSLRFSTLPSLQGRCVSHVIENENFCNKFQIHGKLNMS